MRHRKFLRLAMLVGGPAAARGHLELLWDAAYECGEASVGDATDVELVAGWTGESGVLFNALLTCGGDGPSFIEETGTPNRYQVHDLFHHAPDYVRKRWLREAARRQQRDKVQTESGHCPVSDRTRSGHGADNGRTPAPKILRQDKDQRKDFRGSAGADASGEPLTLTSPESKPKAKTAKKPNPDVKRLVDHYHREFLRTQGSPPLIEAADAAAAPKILAGRPFDGPTGAAWLVTQLLEHPDAWAKERGLLRLRDLPGAVTKILARAGSPGGNGKRHRDATGAVVPQSTEHAEDSIEVDPEGVRRFVRLWRSTATGEVVRRRWGKPTPAPGGGDGDERGQVQTD
jgi:hypothetical protein